MILLIDFVYFVSVLHFVVERLKNLYPDHLSLLTSINYLLEEVVAVAALLKKFENQEHEEVLVVELFAGLLVHGSEELVRIDIGNYFVGYVVGQVHHDYLEEEVALVVELNLMVVDLGLGVHLMLDDGRMILLNQQGIEDLVGFLVVNLTWMRMKYDDLALFG